MRHYMLLNAYPYPIKPKSSIVQAHLLDEDKKIDHEQTLMFYALLPLNIAVEYIKSPNINNWKNTSTN